MYMFSVWKVDEVVAIFQVRSISKFISILVSL